MPYKSDSASSAFLANLLPSKIFKEKKFRGKNKQLNRSIASLTDAYTLGYYPDVDRLAAALSDPELVSFQDKQLRDQLKNISAQTVDIDHLQIGLKLTTTDLLKLIDKDDGIERVRTAARQERLSVSFSPVGYKNQGVGKKGSRSLFTHKYIISVDSEAYRYVNVYLSYSKKKASGKRYNCIIEFIPSRLELHHVSLMFAHINSVLGTRRYEQLLDSAEMIRLDTGYNMKGVSQIFTFTGTKNNYFKVEAQFPTSDEVSTETAYIGSKRNSHCIVYDKTLKENKSFINNVFSGLRYTFDMISNDIEGVSDLFLDQIVCARVESRVFFDKEPVRFQDIESHRSQLEDLYFIRPKAVMSLSQKSRQRLVKDKGISNIRTLLRSCEKRFKGRENSYLLTFDPVQVSAAFSQRLADLKEAIVHPIDDISFEPSVSVKAHVQAARLAIKPLVDSIKVRHDSEAKIVSTDAPVVYVEGSPGSGKTKLIVERVVHLIASGTKPKHISVLAYTNDASEEFAERLAAAGVPVHQMFVGTFSAWCNRVVLQKHFDVIEPDECLEIITTLIPRKLCDDYHLDKNDVASAILRIIEHMANFDTPSLDVAISSVSPHLEDFSDYIEDVIDDFERYKVKRKKASFSDLLSKARQLLLAGKEKPAAVKKLVARVRYLLVDEVQDSNNVQWDILRQYIKEGGNLFCVGDPAQSMYGFRGATSKPLVNFMQVEEAKKFVQTINRRSVAPIVELSNRVRRAINRNYLISSAKRLDGAIPRYIESDDFQAAIRWLVKDIKQRVSEGTVSDILVLCRFNKQLDTVEKAIKKLKGQLKTKAKIKLKALTYHKAKGLQAQSCYVIDSTFGPFRHASVVEERCNVYVAITRAEDYLTLIASKQGTGWYSGNKKKERKFSHINSVFVDLFAPLASSEDNWLLKFERQ